MKKHPSKVKSQTEELMEKHLAAWYYPAAGGLNARYMVAVESLVSFIDTYFSPLKARKGIKKHLKR